MSNKAIKQKIHESIETLNSEELKSAYLVLQGIKNRNTKIDTDKEIVKEKIQVGINQLEKGQGSDFASFLNEAKAKYGNKK